MTSTDDFMTRKPTPFAITRRSMLLGGAATMCFGMNEVSWARSSLVHCFDIVLAGETLIKRARPSLSWRYHGVKEWTSSRPVAIRISPPRSGITKIEVDFGVARATLLRRDSADEISFSGHLTSAAEGVIEVCRFHYFDDEIDDPNLTLVGLDTVDGFRRFDRGSVAPSYNDAFRQKWERFSVRFRGARDPIHDSPNWGLAKDIAILTRDWNDQGWTIGFVGPGKAFGETGLKLENDCRDCFAGVLLDGITIDPGEKRVLETMIVRFGDWQKGLAQWVESCARAVRPRPIKPPMVGYCSWYQREQKVDVADMRRAIAEFADWPVPPGGRLVQIDDGWQNAPGDWTPNAKFASDWAALPEKIANTGSVPGVWLAPTAIHASDPRLAAHPEIIQRDRFGVPAVHFANWGGETYFLDVDQPDAKQLVREPIERARREGWQYLKLDFTYAIAADRAKANTKLTDFEVLRNIYSEMRVAAGPDMLVNACVGTLARYAIGLADVARLGGDVAPRWSTVKGNLPGLLLAMTTNGHWWQGDPDVFYMREEGTSLTAEENALLMGTLGLMGGLYVTSDWPSQWDAGALTKIRRFWTAAGPQPAKRQKILFDATGGPLAYRVSYENGTPLHCLGLYNWSDHEVAIAVELDRLQIAGSKLQSVSRDNGFVISDNVLVGPKQPPHSLRIAELG